MTKSYDIAMFSPSDGLTPIQAQKLNNNFQRLLDLVFGRDENNEYIVRTTNNIKSKISPDILNAIYPIGSIVFVLSEEQVPMFGTWVEITQYSGRYIRVGSVGGDIGGSGSQTITPSMPSHNHAYYKQIVDKTIKVVESTVSTAKDVVTSIKDASTTSNTSNAGDGQSQTISINPPYVILRMFQRIE